MGIWEEQQDLRNMQKILDKCCKLLKCKPDQLLDRIKRLNSTIKETRELLEDSGNGFGVEYDYPKRKTK